MVHRHGLRLVVAQLQPSATRNASILHACPLPRTVTDTHVGHPRTTAIGGHERSLTRGRSPCRLLNRDGRGSGSTPSQLMPVEDDQKQRGYLPRTSGRTPPSAPWGRRRARRGSQQRAPRLYRPSQAGSQEGSRCPQTYTRVRARTKHRMESREDTHISGVVGPIVEGSTPGWATQRCATLGVPR